MAWLLAIDGATETLALALSGPAGELHGREVPGGAQASGQLLPALLALLQDAGVRPQQLDALAFGRGPGAFTSLRAVCAATQGLALGWGKPVLAVDSLLLTVEAAAAGHGTAHWGAVQDARMGELYVATYRRGSRGSAEWDCEASPSLWQPAALLQAWQRDGGPEALAGNGAALLGRAAEPAGDRPAALARLARAAWLRGEAMDAAAAQPLYVRDRVALTTAERAAQAAGASA